LNSALAALAHKPHSVASAETGARLRPLRQAATSARLVKKFASQV
jgi:hypothetical protein